MTDSFPSIAAVILAGGYSRRMGRDKALVEVDGVPMLSRVYRVARSIASRTFVMSAWNERYRDRDDLELDGCEWLDDRQPGAGPLVALGQVMDALQQAETRFEWVLLLACDLPNLEHAYLKALCDRAETSAAQTVAIVPRTHSGWEPLCGLYRRSVGVTLSEFVTGGGRSFQSWLDNLAADGDAEAVAVADGDRDWLRNCNTPNDLSDCG